MSPEEDVRRNLQADLDGLAAELGADKLLVADEALERYSRDETEDLRFLPAAVALPVSTEEVQTVLRFAFEHRIPVRPRGALACQTRTPWVNDRWTR